MARAVIGRRICDLWDRGLRNGKGRKRAEEKKEWQRSRFRLIPPTVISSVPTFRTPVATPRANNSGANLIMIGVLAKFWRN